MHNKHLILEENYQLSHLNWISPQKWKKSKGGSGKFWDVGGPDFDVFPKFKWLNYGPDFDSIWVHDWDKETTGEDGEINRCAMEKHTPGGWLRNTQQGRGGQRDLHQGGGDIEKPTKRNAKQEGGQTNAQKKLWIEWISPDASVRYDFGTVFARVKGVRRFQNSLHLKF